MSFEITLIVIAVTVIAIVTVIYYMVTYDQNQKIAIKNQREIIQLLIQIRNVTEIK